MWYEYYMHMVIALTRMQRSRPFSSLNECVNPEYMLGGNNVTVKDTMDYCIQRIFTKALQRRNRGYRVTIQLPNYNGKRSILQHIFMTLSDKLVDGISIDVGEEAFWPDVDVKFVAMSANIPDLCLPVRWHDNLPDWTWECVCQHPELYSSGSKDVWPPAHYKMRAQRDRLQRMQNESTESKSGSVLKY